MKASYSNKHHSCTAFSVTPFTKWYQKMSEGKKQRTECTKQKYEQLENYTKNIHI